MSHLSIIICPEWRLRGFAHLIHNEWFDQTSTILGLSYLSKHIHTVKKKIRDTKIQSMTVVFIDSVFQPLYQSVLSLTQSVPTSNVIRVIVESIPKHLS